MLNNVKFEHVPEKSMLTRRDLSSADQSKASQLMLAIGVPVPITRLTIPYSSVFNVCDSEYS